MVPDPSSVSRRTVLATLGGGVAALAGGTAVVGATEPTALPDPITDAATKYYPTPPRGRHSSQPPASVVIGAPSSSTSPIASHRRWLSATVSASVSTPVRPPERVDLRRR
ncbi:hypothetical protein DJ72_01810, partial [Halorubrum distributum]